MSENSKEKKNSSMSWKYSNALESIEHISISPVYKLFIGGKFVNPISKKYFHSFNPANSVGSREPIEVHTLLMLVVESCLGARRNTMCGVALK